MWEAADATAITGSRRVPDRGDVSAPGVRSHEINVNFRDNVGSWGAAASSV